MSDPAVLAIRSAVQAASLPDAQTGGPADLDAAAWLGSLLGYRWPNSYMAVLSKHDGASAGGAIFFSIVLSIAEMLIFREKFRSKGFWPVGGDGCGNYFVLATHELVSNECPVLFLESSADYMPTGTRYSTYSQFVVAEVVERRRVGTSFVPTSTGEDPHDQTINQLRLNLRTRDRLLARGGRR